MREVLRNVSLLKKLLVILVTAVMLMSIMSCGANTTTKTTDSGTTATGEPVTISILVDYSAAEPPTKDNQVTKEFEKKTNTKLDIMWTNNNDYLNKLNVTLAGGAIPDLTKVKSSNTSGVDNPLAIQLIRNGGVWDLGPYIKDYPNLAAYPKEAMDITKVDGKQYYLPSVRPIAGSYFIVIRQDWLDKLSLKSPTTMDEFYDCLLAFTTGDPDGDGQANTFGFNGELSLDSRLDTYIFTCIFNGTNGQWKEVDGKIVHVDTLPETRESLLWMKKLYDNKIIPKDFSVMKQTQYQDLLNAGTAGAGRGDTADAWIYTAEARKINPKIEYVYVPYLSGPKGPFAIATNGSFGAFIVPKSSNETKLKKALELMDYGASEEGSFMALYGLKGIHYNLVDGLPIATPQQATDSVSQGTFGKIFERWNPYLWTFWPGMDKAYMERNVTFVDEATKHLVFNPVAGLISDTAVKFGLEFEKKSDELRTKIILGVEPITAWDTYVAQLASDANLKKMTDEYSAGYAAAHAN